MTDLILYSKPFDWNDNLSEEAIIWRVRKNERRKRDSKCA